MRVAAIILAAGLSTRMGAPKALLEKGGELALARIVRLAHEAGCRPVVVVLGGHAWWVQNAAREALADARVMVNPTPEAGRTSSLKVGIQGAGEAGAALVWPVDHPDVAPATVKALVAAATRDGIVVPRQGEARGHPIVLGRPALREAAALADDAPLRDVVRRDPARVKEVAVDDLGVAANLDTPEDAARAGWRVPLDNDAPDNTCFVCSPSNPAGLRLQFYKEGDAVVADFALDNRFSGWPGYVLDGVRYGILSDAIAWTAFGLTGTITATVTPPRADLDGPLRTGAPARVVGRIARRDGDRLTLRAEIEQDGRVVDAMEEEDRMPTADDLRRFLATLPASLRPMLEERLRAIDGGA